MGFRAPDIAIDLGTTNTLVYVKRKGIVISEPTIVVVEAMAGLVIADALLENMGARMDHLKALYTK